MIMMTKMTEKAYILCQKSDVLFIGGQEFDEESFPTRQSRPFSWKMKMSVQVKIKNAFSPVSEEKVEICPEMRNYYLWAPSPHPKVFMHFFAHLRTIYQESCHKSYSLSRKYKTQKSSEQTSWQNSEDAIPEVNFDAKICKGGKLGETKICIKKVKR